MIYPITSLTQKPRPASCEVGQVVIGVFSVTGATLTHYFPISTNLMLMNAGKFAFTCSISSSVRSPSRK